jgi:transcriptional regulator with XRE-family HTH domain
MAARQRLGVVLARHRAERRLSQEALSTRCGFHRTYWGALERGHKSVPLPTLVHIASVLGCPASELLREAGL